MSIYTSKVSSSFSYNLDITTVWNIMFLEMEEHKINQKI